MNNKKGFTMVELLAVIAILATILAIAVPQVLDSVERNKQKSLDIFIENIKTTTEGYFSEEDVRIAEGLDNPDGSTNWGTTITLQDLVDAGYFKSSIKNPKTEKTVSLDTKIAVNYNENKTLDIEVGYGKDSLLIVPKVLNITKGGTDAVQIIRYEEDGSVNNSLPTSTINQINPDGSIGGTKPNINTSSYGAYKVTYDMGLDDDNPTRTVYVSDKLSTNMFGSAPGEGYTLPAKISGNYVSIKETTSPTPVKYRVMNFDKQGIKIVRDAPYTSSYGANMCWRLANDINYCNNLYNYADSDVYKALNNQFIATLADKKKLVNYYWQIGQQALPVSNAFSTFTESAGLRQSKVGLVTMHEYYTVAGCTDYVTCTVPTSNYLTSGKSLPFFTLTTANFNDGYSTQPYPYFIGIDGKIKNVSALTDPEKTGLKTYIYPAIVLPLDTMIIGGDGTSGTPYILKF